jgi:ketosteroid isomerase-like protein/dienelactone hydrolase
MRKLFHAAALLTLFLAPAHASAQDGGDGRLVEQAAVALPSYEQISERFKRLYTREAVERVRGASDLELLRVKYTSDGLKVVGFIYKPKRTDGRLPAVIWNRGGAGGDALIGTENFFAIHEMQRYASEGFVVLAPQYRGHDGGEGRDEVGGADTNDVLNIVGLARTLPYVDAERLFMVGFSRGAVMTLQALRRGAPVRAAVVVGAPTDLALSWKENTGIRELARTVWPGGESRLEENIEARSSVRWADKLDAPLLVFHGGADTSVSTRHALDLAARMDAAGRLYELVVYAKDDHFVTLNGEDRLRRSIEWFKNPRTVPVSLALRGAVREKGVAAAVALYHELKKGLRASRYDFAEAHLNALGYELLGAGRVTEAVEIFKLNVAAYPAEFNTYDSLAEAYAASGQKEPAILNYQKSLGLNPRNTNAADALKRLEGGEEDVRRAVEKLARDFNARDAKSVMSNFAADVLLVSPNRPDVDYKTMDEGFARAYEKPPETPYRVVTKVEEVGVSGDLAFVRLMWLREAKDDRRLLRREKDFEIWRRQADGRWKLARGYSFTFEGDFPVAEPGGATTPPGTTGGQGSASGAGRGRRPAPNASEDASAVKAALDNLLRAYNRRDLEAAMAAYAPDALLSYPGTPDSGYAHARASYARRFAGAPPFPVTISFRLEELQASGDLAFARLLWLVERDSDKKTLSRHKDLEVWRRQPDGSWALYRGLSFHLPADETPERAR